MRRVPFASANGFGTARDVAKLYGVLSAGGTYNSKCVLVACSFHTVRFSSDVGVDRECTYDLFASRMFMSEDMVKHLSEAVVSGTDFVMGIPTSFGRGTSVKHTPAVRKK